MPYPCTWPGLPLEVLAQDFWVPGSTARSESPHVHGNQLFGEILATTDRTAILYAERATEDIALFF